MIKILPFEEIHLNSYKNTIISCFFLFIIIFSKQNIQTKIKNLRSSIVDVKLYTIMVSNLPDDITAKDIKIFFENLTKYKVEKINLAYDISEFKENFKKKIKLIE